MNYEAYLTSQRLSASQFEEKLSKALLVGMVDDLFKRSISLTKSELDRIWEFKNTKINLEYVHFVKDDLENSIQISDSKVSSFINENENLVKSHYDLNQSKFSSEEEVHVQHILISKSKEGRNLENSKILAHEVLIRARTEDFSNLAKEISDDTGTSFNGGEVFQMGAPSLQSTWSGGGVSRTSGSSFSSWWPFLLLVCGFVPPLNHG